MNNMIAYRSQIQCTNCANTDLYMERAILSGTSEKKSKSIKDAVFMFKDHVLRRWWGDYGPNQTIVQFECAKCNNYINVRIYKDPKHPYYCIETSGRGQ